ncbi:MAG: tRNA 2-selenouridine(34) synthase MnmH [Sedimenticolaceae bacterium]
MPSSDPSEIDDLRALFINDTPLLDVRAPIEFADGAFPCAENLPLIDDEERHRIGLTYQQQGQDRAIELGEHLVSGEIKAQRVGAWRDFLRRHPDAVLYCFRGGMRSRISQQWLRDEAGIHCPRVVGGYKAMRRFLIDELDRNSPICRPVVIGGRTGVGKTRLLAACDAHIDLERLAHHRGSAFGHHPQPQPSQIDFENALSIALLKHVAAGNRAFAVEDESRNIGSRHIPPRFFAALEEAPLVLLEATDEERIDITLQEYVHDALAAFCAESGEGQGFTRWATYLQDSLGRIRRRLGSERHARVNRLLQDAIAQHATDGDTSGHRAWIEFLLHEYYDGMYGYQLQNKADRVVFRGPRAAVLDFIAATYDITVRNTP